MNVAVAGLVATGESAPTTASKKRRRFMRRNRRPSTLVLVVADDGCSLWLSSDDAAGSGCLEASVLTISGAGVDFDSKSFIVVNGCVIYLSFDRLTRKYQM